MLGPSVCSSVVQVQLMYIHQAEITAARLADNGVRPYRAAAHHISLLTVAAQRKLARFQI